MPILQTIKRYSNTFGPAIFGWAALLAMASTTDAKPRPYIGFVYPAGGQQGTKFQIRLGGQGLAAESSVQVSGKGVRAKVIEYLRRIEPPGHGELLREQLKELKRPPVKQAQQSLGLAARIEQRFAASPKRLLGLLRARTIT